MAKAYTIPSTQSFVIEFLAHPEPSMLLLAQKQCSFYIDCLENMFVITTILAIVPKLAQIFFQC